MVRTESHPFRYQRFIPEDGRVECSACGRIYPMHLWEDTETTCDAEVCDNHNAARCPNCGTVFDLVYSHIWNNGVLR